jgi:hypothetical protein
MEKSSKWTSKDCLPGAAVTMLSLRSIELSPVWASAGRIIKPAMSASLGNAARSDFKCFLISGRIMKCHPAAASRRAPERYTSGLRKDHVWSSFVKGRENLFRCVVLEHHMIESRKSGDLKWGSGLDFIYSDQRCDTFTSFDECAFEFSIRYLKCAES